MDKLSVLYQNRDGTLLANEYQPMLSNGANFSRHESTRYININVDTESSTLPELYEHKELCCGCSACLIVCPKSEIDTNIMIPYKFMVNSDRIEYYPYTGAISMLPDEEGFMYPVVDSNKCIRCFKCMKVCPYK